MKTKVTGSYYSRNKDIVNAKRRIKYKENSEQLKAKSRQYVAQNKEKIKEASRLWRQKNKEKVKEKLQSYRARKREAFVETVKFSVVYKRDNGVCYMCKTNVTTVLLEDKKLPLDYAVLDHVIPLSKGGLHCYENIKLACHSCNSKKSDRIPKEGAQLNLFAQPGAKIKKPKKTDEEIKRDKILYMKAYRIENKDKIRAHEKLKRESKRAPDYQPKESIAHLPPAERKKIYQSRYHEKCKDKINARHRKRRAENKAKGIKEPKPSREKGIEYSKRYRENNKEAINERRRNRRREAKAK